jgi:hypothetical protein
MMEDANYVSSLGADIYIGPLAGQSPCWPIPTRTYSALIRQLELQGGWQLQKKDHQFICRLFRSIAIKFNLIVGLSTNFVSDQSDRSFGLSISHSNRTNGVSPKIIVEFNYKSFVLPYTGELFNI